MTKTPAGPSSADGGEQPGLPAGMDDEESFRPELVDHLVLAPRVYPLADALRALDDRRAGPQHGAMQFAGDPVAVPAGLAKDRIMFGDQHQHGVGEFAQFGMPDGKEG